MALPQRVAVAAHPVETEQSERVDLQVTALALRGEIMATTKPQTLVQTVVLVAQAQAATAAAATPVSYHLISIF